MVHHNPSNFFAAESHDGGQTVSPARGQQVNEIRTINILNCHGHAWVIAAFCQVFINRLIFYDDTTTTKSWDWDDENLKRPLKNREELVSASDLNVPTQNYSFHPSCQCVRSVLAFPVPCS